MRWRRGCLITSWSDPFGGLKALAEKVLRTPGKPEDSFSDDPLRMLRAARFSAKLGFIVTGDVRAAMTEQAGQLLVSVSTERITDELTKLMLTPDPVRGIELLVDTGVAGEVLPEIRSSGWKPTSTSATRTSTSTA